MREEIEERIRTVLANETDAILLSHQLFAPGALFSQLANSQAERAALVQTLLFRQAQARLTELQRAESAGLVAAVERMKAAQKAALAPSHAAPAANGPASPVNGAPAEQPTRSDTPS